ncbi:TonB-dependent receptor plug domain-containing protein [Adhaeribacter soli]|uniref:TonB-dependent receptor plug domain-containing protein n=1 Tax=Adhaeribacter soli TaxID=2607655 RepID=A0A5N1IUW5_9BACT|nr:TonB-dependent receptor [Adhaeribacter soli]KAA9333810.1 TonB-dependent receptor plug domain-containing protein [Adhaeribacter soli]
MTFKLFALAGLFLASCLAAQVQAQGTDTLAGKQIKEVQITARRPETFAPGSRQTVIDSAFLENNNAGNLADILQHRTAVYVKSYGSGQLATLAFRGTSASHTAVLWNGFNITQPTLGQLDFSLLPVSAISGVQLQHGSAGSNFGSGAIGGAVLLSSPTEIQPGIKLHVQQDLGSFGQRFSQVSGSYGSRKFGIDAAVFRKETKNDFPFTNTARFGSPEERQENAGSRQTGFTNNLTLRLSPKSKLFIRNWYTGSDVEVQPNMASENNHARNLNRNLRLMSEWEQRSGLGNTNVRVAYFHDFMRYTQDGLLPSDSKVKTYQLQAEQGFFFKDWLRLNLGGDAQLFDAEVADYGRKVTEKRASAFALLRAEVLKNLSLNLNWRQTFIQGFNPPPSPAAGFSYGLLNTEKSALIWKGNMSRGYRVPTLNDRFWPPGNPNLHPEDSRNYETGLAYGFTAEKVSFETELTAYRMLVDNWIQWLPNEHNKLTPINLKKVKAQGFESSAKIRYRFNGGQLITGGNYAYTLSKQEQTYVGSDELAGKQLIYVPVTTGTAFSDLTYKTWLLTLNWQYTGYRFINPENTRWLPAYGLLDITAGKTFRMKCYQVQALGRIHNLGNTIYQNLEYLAMPGRSYSLSLRFQFDSNK